MEAIEELPPVNSIADVVKDVATSGDPPAELVESSTCKKTNGDAVATTLLESADAGYPVGSVAVSEAETLQSVQTLLQHDMFTTNNASATAHTDTPIPPEAELLAAMETSAAVEHLLETSKSSVEATEEVVSSAPVVSEQCASVVTDTSVETVQPAKVLEEVTKLEIVGENVSFTTEIVVEKTDVEVTDSHNNTNNLLNELGHGIELSEVLRSSDNTDNVENNNCPGEEVFNKEELLDILEGNDEADSHYVLDTSEDNKPHDLNIDKEIALNQLSRLQSCRTKGRLPNNKLTKKSPTTVKRRQNKKNSPKTKESVNTESTVKESNVNESNVIKSNESADTTKEEKIENDSVVNKLVKDWDDDDPLEIDNSAKALDETNDLVKIEDLEVTIEDSIEQDMGDSKMVTPTPNNTTDNIKESGDEAHPQRRHARVIKKKIPFDPDNPPTFTKKVAKKESKEKDPIVTPTEKLHTLTKTDLELVQRAKSKSPPRKMQWKKPPPKNGNSTKNSGKRLTEVDKLLMDEGAVNMIYQLTPEAPKGRKNMKTKAAFIKKLQSSKPDGNEMKFRERKKDIKLEDGEPKKIVGGKQRASINSSVKSPAGLDDFEAHSADDSIIYRRHSSSSYSDCMSPRRLSDVDPSVVQAAACASRQASETQNITQNDTTEHSTSTEVFMDDSTAGNSTKVINKGDCLSMKDKLNRKISQALNKRKRESIKTDKSAKQKRLSKEAEVVKVEKTDKFKYVSITFDQKLAEISVRNTVPSDGILVFKELEQALITVDSMKEISVTLLTSECGGLSPKMDLTPLLDTNIEKRMNYAYEVAESIRVVLSCVASHSKLLVSGVWGACGGVALALLVLSDAALAADGARLSVEAVPPAPGLAVLTAGPKPLPPALVNELVVFGRWLSTAEAAGAGLVTRVWPGDAAAVRLAAATIAKQPPQNILLKKQLLSLRKTSEAMAAFHSSLEKERDMLVEYWTSVEGQDIIRANINAE